MADNRADLTIWTDSASTCSAVKELTKLLTGPKGRLPLAYFRKKFANFSIIHSIVTNIIARKTAGLITTIKWVGSHSVGANLRPEQVMNNLADMHAVAAREGNVNIPTAQECYISLPSFFLQHTDNDIIIEKIPHSIITHCTAIHYANLHMDRACKSSKRLADARKIIAQAPRETSIFFRDAIAGNSNAGIFLFNLLYSNLKNPHDNFVSHEKSLPDIYPTDTCPLCDRNRADLAHIFCTCTHIKKARQVALRSAATAISQQYKAPPGDASRLHDWLVSACIPSDPALFTHGIISREHFASLEVICSSFNFEKHGPSKIQYSCP